MVESSYHGHVVVDAEMFPDYRRFRSIAPLGNTTESNAGRGGVKIEVPRANRDTLSDLLDMTPIYSHE